MNDAHHADGGKSRTAPRGGQVYGEAARFLTLLDPDATRFTFQTFDDDADRKDKRLVKVIHGSLAENFDQLCRLNDQGAGVFVTVNETNLEGRKAENIVRVRALFMDLDGAPRPKNFLTPSIEVETSSERWHVYYLVSDVTLDEFTAKQKALIAKFGSDPAVHDLSRVMRLPGFFHRKKEPRLVRIIWDSDAVYGRDRFPDVSKPDDDYDVPDYLKDFDEEAIGLPDTDEPSRWQKLNTEALTRLDDWVLAVFGSKAKKRANGDYRVSSKDLGRELKEDLALTPKGIVDFGVRDMGDGRDSDKRMGPQSPLDVVIEHTSAKNLDAAFAWLSEKLGRNPGSAASDEPAEPKTESTAGGDEPKTESTAGGDEPKTESAASDEPKTRAHAEPATTPVDLWNKFKPPSLPTGLLPPVIEHFALEQGVLMGADPAGLAGSAIAVCSAAIPDFIKIKVKRNGGWMESTRAWIGLVGDPSAKKTPIINRATRQITRVDAAMFRAYLREKALWDALPKEEKKAAAPPRQTRLKLEDTTVEAAQEVMRDSPNGVLCLRDELSGWFGTMDKYAGHRGAAMDRAFWLQAYDGNSYAYNRIGRGSGMIENLSASVLGGIQPEPMRKLIEGSVDDGLIQRIMPIMVRRGSVGIDEAESHAAAAYDDLIARLHRMKQPFDDVVFDEPAREIRLEMERRHHDLTACEALHKKLASHIGKYDGIFARLCLLWHCIESTGQEPGPRVTADTARRVADFLHSFLLPHAMAFYTDVLGASEDHDRLAAVAGYILAHKVPVLTNRIVQRGDRTMRKFDQRETERVCQQLDALGWLNRISGLRATDPPRWVVNPEVHRLFADRAREEEERRRRDREMIAAMFASKEPHP